MDDADCAALKAKYIDPDPVPGVDDVVATIIRTEELEVAAFPSRGTDDYNCYLFDPSRSPRMHQIAADAHRALKLGITSGTIGCPDGVSDALQVYVVGDDRVRTCRPGRAADRLAGFLRIVDAIHTEAGVYECNVRISEDCEGLGVGTMLTPLLYGGVLLVFECCGSCHSTARELSTLGYRVGEIAAHERALAVAPAQPATHARSVTPTRPTLCARIWRWLRGGS